MSYTLSESSATWVAGVRGLEANAVLTGGPDCPDNLPLQDLANRTAYLKSHVDTLESTRATIASPTFTGDPKAPTPNLADNDTSIATTGFVQSLVNGRLVKSVAGGANVTLTAAEAGYGILEFTGALTASIAVLVPATSARWTVKNSTTGAFTLRIRPSAGTGVLVAQGASKDLWCDGTNVYDGVSDFTDVALAGTPTAPTAAAGTSTTQVATTAFVQQELAADLATAAPLMAGAAAVGVATKVAREDHRHPTDTTRAPLASPALTGTPTAPTAAAGTSTTQIATTAFVQQELAGELATTAPLMAGAAAVGVATKVAREDHRHPTDTTRAPLASPALTGTPTAPTAAAGTSTTQIATTAFVQQELAGELATAAPLMAGAAAVGVATKVAREDHRHPTDTSRAPLASPALTGTPTVPTAADGTNTTQAASTAFVQNAIGGVLAKTVTAGQYTLTDAEASNPVIVASGTLTANAAFLVPTGVKRVWTVVNNTTGAFNLNVRPLGGTGVTVTQGKRTMVYTDGTNCYPALDEITDVSLLGVPTAPTAAAGTSTTQLATTAFVSTPGNVPGQLIGIQVFTAGGTYNSTVGTKSIVVDGEGGGGAGGGVPATSGTQYAVAGGGAAGSRARARFTSNFSGVTVTIGSAGVGVAGGAGGNGGTTSFGALMSCPGGPGGPLGVAVSVGQSVISGVSQLSSSPSGGNVEQSPGASGSPGLAVGSGLCGGAGASSRFGVGGNPVGTGGPGTSGSANAQGNGSGGSGACSNVSAAAAAGGSGRPGILIVFEYA